MWVAMPMLQICGDKLRLALCHCTLPKHILAAGHKKISEARELIPTLRRRKVCFAQRLWLLTEGGVNTAPRPT